MTIKDALKFILRYRKDKAFHDWSISDICLCLHNCITNNTFCHTEDEEGHITGIMVGHINNNKFHVDNILSIRRNMPSFINFIVSNYPTITHITTVRHGRFWLEYDVNEQNYKRFMKGTK